MLYKRFFINLFILLSLFFLINMQMMAASDNTPITTQYEFVYESHNQSIWGPGEVWSIPDTAIPIIDRFDWDEDFEWDAELDSKEYVQEEIPNAPEDISIALSGRTYGEFALDAVFRDFGAASADIVYPVEVTTEQSSPLSPGETVIVETDWIANDNTQLQVSPLRGHIDFDATYEFYGELYGKACFFSCADTHFGTPIHVAKKTSTVFSVDIQDPISLDDIPGFEGSIRIPVIEHEVTKGSDGRTLYAEGSDSNFVDITADIDFWLGYVLEFCEELDLGITDIDICLDLLDIDTTFMMSQYQKLTLTPDLFVTIAFAEPIDYQIFDDGNLVDSGTAVSITYNADHIVELSVPTDWASSPFVTPTFELETLFENQTETTFSQDLSVEVVTLTEPIEIGPLIDYSIELYSYTNDDLFDQDIEPWSLRFAAQWHAYFPFIWKE